MIEQLHKSNVSSVHFSVTNELHVSQNWHYHTGICHQVEEKKLQYTNRQSHAGLMRPSTMVLQRECYASQTLIYRTAICLQTVWQLGFIRAPISVLQTTSTYLRLWLITLSFVSMLRKINFSQPIDNDSWSLLKRNDCYSPRIFEECNNFFCTFRSNRLCWLITIFKNWATLRDPQKQFSNRDLNKSPTSVLALLELWHPNFFAIKCW